VSTAGFQLAFTPKGSSTSYYARLDTNETQAWLAANDSLRDMDWQVPARSFPGAVTDLTFNLYTKDLPEIVLNRMVYPESGIMEWGFIYCIFSGAEVEAIKQAPTGTIAMWVTGPTTDTLNFDYMTLLASIPISEVGHNASGRITALADTDDKTTRHLCLFVDDRYWRANFAPNANIDGVPENWNLLINACVQSCVLANGGEPIVLPAIDPSYGVPGQYSDWMEICQYNAAVMLDAALKNTGMRIVRAINGNYSIITVDRAAQIENATTYTGHFLRSGGDWSRNQKGFQYLGSLPGSVTFYFPLWNANLSPIGPPYPPPGPQWLYQYDNDEGMYHVRSPLNTSYYYPINVTIAQAFADLGLPAPATPAWGGTRIFRDTARACGDETTEPGSGGNPPTNLGLLNSLALTVAGDYYLEKLYTLQQETWNGFIQPSGSGWFTYIYYMGLDCYTKVRGKAANVEFEQLMHDVDCYGSSSEGSSESSGSQGESTLCVADGNSPLGPAIPGALGTYAQYTTLHEKAVYTNGTMFYFTSAMGTNYISPDDPIADEALALKNAVYLVGPTGIGAALGPDDTGSVLVGPCGSGEPSGSGSAGSASGFCGYWLPPCPDGSCWHAEPIYDCNGNNTGTFQLVCGHGSGS